MLHASSCSGDIYARLPPRYAAGVAPASLLLKLMLKSASFGDPSALISTLAGLISRRNTPRRCPYTRPPAPPPPPPRTPSHQGAFAHPPPHLEIAHPYIPS